MSVHLQVAVADSDLPSSFEGIALKVDGWVHAALAHANHGDADVTVRVVAEPEMIRLNNRFRGKNKSTNVLSFPYEKVSNIEYHYLGDIAICLDVIKAESERQQKGFESHFAHMVVHGTLHLCGFDHGSDARAGEMEMAEQKILAEFNLR